MSPATSFCYAIAKIVLISISFPLVFGGLVAAGETGEVRVLVCGIVSSLLLGTVCAIEQPREAASPPEEARLA